MNYCNFCPTQILKSSSSRSFNYKCDTCNTAYWITTSTFNNITQKRDYYFIYLDYLLWFNYRIPFQIHTSATILAKSPYKLEGSKPILTLDFIPDITPSNVKERLPRLLKFQIFI